MGESYVPEGGGPRCVVVNGWYFPGNKSCTCGLVVYVAKDNIKRTPVSDSLVFSIHSLPVALATI